ncbi:MAG: alpha-glycosidase [Bacillota bacterium]|jgi:cyclomaltodextrinase
MKGKDLRIAHHQSQRYIHPTGPNKVLVRLRIYLEGAAVPESCSILYSSGSGWHSSPMLISVMTRDSVYYEVELELPNPTVKYYFEVKTETTLYSYGDTAGVKDQQEVEIIPFVFDWVPAEVFKTPEWVREGVFYQIFPERFYNGNPKNDPKETVPWDSSPSATNFFGGDLEGIEKKIPYLVDLGITAVWLTPIFTSVSNHKYNTSDYMNIDPHFGDKKTFRRLVQKLHDNGIRIILDCVFNHTGTNFWAFRDVLEKGEASRYKDWYYINEFPVQIEPRPTYECWWDIPDLPKLRVPNPEVREYLLSVAAYWTEEFAIDGWRLDVPNEVSHDFWVEFRKVVKNINPDCYIVGEIWDDGRPWLQGDQFDAVMNYLFRDNVLDFFARKKMGVSDFEQHMGILRLKYQQQVNLSLLNLMGSHDTARMLTVFKKERPHMAGTSEPENINRKMRPAIIFQMTYLGAPMIYYGDEIGMTGGPDPGCRKAMVWEDEGQDKTLLNLYTALIKLRKESEPLKKGAFLPLTADDANKVYAFARKFAEQLCLVVLNLSSKDLECSIPVRLLGLPEGIRFRDALSSQECAVKDHKLVIPLLEADFGAVLTPII